MYLLLVLLLIHPQISLSQTGSNSTTPCSIPSFSPSAVTVAGGNGQGFLAQQLNLPYGLFVTVNNSVYIGDVGNDRIQVWPSGASTGITVAGGQGFGSGPTQVDGARDVYIDSTNNLLLVLDTGNQRIQQYNLSINSTVGTTIMSNLPLSCRNFFIEQTTNTIYISDMYNHRVLRMPNATLLAGGNTFGNQSNQLYYPAGLYVTPMGTIYVADSYNHRVQMWTAGANVGITVAGGNGRGSAANQLNNPMHVIYMPSTGNLIVTDSGNARIQVWAPNATCGITIISSQFVYPMTSAFDLNYQYLYVLDQVACLVKRFTLLSNNNLCIPGSCIMVASSTSTIITTLSSLTSTAALLSTAVQQTDGKLPSWIITFISIGGVLIVLIGLSIYVLVQMIKSRSSVKPFV